MQLLPAVMPLTALLLFALSARQLRRFRVEVGHLPPLVQRSLQDLHPLMGDDLRPFFPFLQDLPPQGALVQFASSSCSSCHSALEEFLLYNQQHQIPFFVLPDSSDKQGLDEFIERYRDLVPVIPVSDELQHDLQIQSFPFFFWIGQNGQLRFATSLVKSIHNQLNLFHQNATK